MIKSDPPILDVATAKPEGTSAVPACPVCGASEWRTFRKGKDIRRPKEQSVFHIDQCQSCGHLMQNPLPSPDELRRSYAVEYAPYRPAWKEKGLSLWRFLRYLTDTRHTHRLKKFAHGNRLLDVGCGAGDFIYAAHKAGWQVAAVEYNRTLANMLRSELNFDVHPGVLESGLWQPESFDAVTIWSVIEHVPDPVEVMELAASYLRKGGVLFLQFPTAQGLSYGNAFSQYWEILDLPRHINYFGKSSIAALCDRAGLDLIAYRTSFIDFAWCCYTSSMNFANSASSKISKYIRLALLVPVIICLLPCMALFASRALGTEAWAVATKR